MAITLHDLDHVEVAVSELVWAWAETNRETISDHWAELTAQKPALFNGTVLLLHEWLLEGSTFRGACLRTDFASFMAWRDFGRPDTSMRNFFAMAALRSSDGAFLLGEMNQHTANAGRIYFASGTPDLSDIQDGMVDLAGSVLRELEEETGLAANEVSLAPHWTVVADGPRFAFMRGVEAPLDAVALKARIEGFLAADPEPELSGMHIVRQPRDADNPAIPDFQRAYLHHALEDQRTG